MLQCATDFVDDVRERAEHLCRQLVAPELAEAGATLYVIADCDNLFGDSSGDGEIWGIYGPGLDLICKSQLERAGRWEGRGLCLAVHTSAVLERIANSSRPSRAGFEMLFLATALHECAHPLDEQIKPLPEPKRFDVAKEIAWFIEINNWIKSRPPTPRAFRQHSARFIRAAIHLSERAVASGALQLTAGLAADVVCGLERYGIPSVSRYRAALADELLDCETPISHFLERPLPPEFETALNRSYTAPARCRSENLCH